MSTIEAQARANDPFPLKMHDQLYRNLGNGRFEDVSRRAGAVFTAATTSAAARRSATSTTTATRTSSSAWRQAGRSCSSTTSATANHWLGLRLVERRGSATCSAPALAIVVAPGRTLWRRARADGSYASANDPRVLVGLGPQAPATVAVQVQWPDGTQEAWTGVTPGAWTTLTQGDGHPGAADGASVGGR